MPWVDVTDPAEIEAANALLGTDNSLVMNRDERLKNHAAALPVLSAIHEPVGPLTEPQRRDIARSPMLPSGPTAAGAARPQASTAA
ncbi:MAG: hypothetical protein WCI05_15365, partial [Myxococcales bacterium]